MQGHSRYSSRSMIRATKHITTTSLIFSFGEGYLVCIRPTRGRSIFTCGIAARSTAVPADPAPEADTTPTELRTLVDRQISLWSGLVWSGLVWSGLVWSGLVWSCLVRRGHGDETAELYHEQALREQRGESDSSTNGQATVGRSVALNAMRWASDSGHEKIPIGGH